MNKAIAKQEESEYNKILQQAVVRRLSADLKEHFPEMGVSPRNLWNMKKYYERFCQSLSKVQQAVALLPWGIFCN